MSQTPNKSQDKKSFLDRLWVSVVAIPIVVALIWFGAPWFTLLVVVWGMGGAYEFYHQVQHSKGLSPLTIFGMLWVGLLIASPHFSSVPHFKDISPTQFAVDDRGDFFTCLSFCGARAKKMPLPIGPGRWAEFFISAG